MAKGDYILVVLALFFINGLVRFNSGAPPFIFCAGGLVIVLLRFCYLIYKKLKAPRS
jgi:hypothetical protein